MRRLLVVSLVLCVVAHSGLRGQQQETLLSGNIESGGFGGFVVRFSEIGGAFAVLAGGRGGWIINHTFVLGGGGYGLANDVALTVALTCGDA